DADLADGAERFVVESGHTESGAQFFIELTQIFQVLRQRGNFLTVVGEKKLLVTGVPQTRELSTEHDRGHDRHLIKAVGTFAKLGAAAVLFHANNAAGAANGKSQCRQTFDGFLREALVDIPHDGERLAQSARRSEHRRPREKTSSRLAGNGEPRA